MPFHVCPGCSFKINLTLGPLVIEFVFLLSDIRKQYFQIWHVHSEFRFIRKFWPSNIQIQFFVINVNSGAEWEQIRICQVLPFVFSFVFCTLYFVLYCIGSNKNMRCVPTKYLQTHREHEVAVGFTFDSSKQQTFDF